MFVQIERDTFVNSEEVDVIMSPGGISVERVRDYCEKYSMYFDVSKKLGHGSYVLLKSGRMLCVSKTPRQVAGILNTGNTRQFKNTREQTILLEKVKPPPEPDIEPVPVPEGVERFKLEEFDEY